MDLIIGTGFIDLKRKIVGLKNVSKLFYGNVLIKIR